jgi:hypothetical protein
VKEWAMSRMGQVGMPWVLPSVKTSSKFLFIFFNKKISLCCPVGIMGKRRVILQVFCLFFLNAHSKVTLQKKPKKKEVTLH